MFRRGHVYWARMPGELERRPVVVLSPDRRNELADTVVVVPCSTMRRFGAWHVGLRRGEGGLAEDSAAKSEEITTLAKARLVPGALGGPLPAARLAEVRDALLRALDYS